MRLNLAMPSALMVVVLMYLVSLASVEASTPYLCKCTCFTTNTTIVPIYKPTDTTNPCATCTRQFCIDQNLAGCEGARIENPNADTGTGWEGEVWARCFQRDSGKDQTIVSLYLFTIIGLLLAAALREHISIWLDEFKTGGPAALGRSMQASGQEIVGRLRRGQFW